MASYKYVSLPNGDDNFSIRLIILPPGEIGGDISVQLSSHHLKDAPKYEAVSYEWGDAEDKVSIDCNGKSLLVPRTIIPFLQRTQAKGRERTLWIDSICIDQEDKKEKDSQVGRMSEIYSNASRTLIWLGPERDDSTVGLDFATHLYKVARQTQDQKSQRKTRWSVLRSTERLPLPYTRKWNAFFKLLERSWFTRAWIVQEVALSSEPWIICGDKAIRWIILVAAIYHLWWDQVWIFEFYGPNHLDHVLYMQLAQQECETKKESRDYDLLHRHRSSRSTDPKDKIFAFYGLACRNSLKELRITPTYEDDETAADVFIRYATQTLKNTTHLDLLSIPRLPHGLSVPSWVPDWSVPEPKCVSLLPLDIYGTNAIDPGYRATLTSQYEVMFSADGRTLRLSGYEVDSVAAMSRVWDISHHTSSTSLIDRAKVIQVNQTLVYDWVKLIDSSPGESLSKSELDEMTWKLCTAEYHYKGEDYTREAWQLWEKRQRILRFLHWIGLHDFLWVYVIIVIVEQFLRLVGYKNPELKFRAYLGGMVYRRAVKTKRRRRGMAPALTEVGDRIVLLQGGKMPFVLRPRGDQWELIGDAYVQGMMKGEAWNECKENGRQQKYFDVA